MSFIAIAREAILLNWWVAIICFSVRDLKSYTWSEKKFMADRFSLKIFKSMFFNFWIRYFTRIESYLLLLHYCFLLLIFLSEFLLRAFTIHRTAEKEGTYFLTPLNHFLPLYRDLDISRTIAAEISPLHIASN